MTLWIVTIGSSDVQLDSNTVNRSKGRTEKQRSEKVWSYWYEGEIKAKCLDLPFEPKPLYPDHDESYRIAPRVLGEVYQASSPEQQREMQSYLTFPLLDNFVSELKKLSAVPDAIAILLTDQSLLFAGSPAQRKLRCPYWQDTYELKLILESYFKEEAQFPEATQIWLTLEPRSETESDSTQLKGLDNWNSVLSSVRNQLHDLKIDENKMDLESIEKVYVSHQAGTPAISSAVQFCSLAQFGKKVTFLVSNEQDDTLSDTVESSAYLRGIQREQALQLLKRHDYAGVQDLVAEYLDGEAQNRLNAAIQWNRAQFIDFAKILKDDPVFQSLAENCIKEDNWWWTAYEAAYLGLVRLSQSNTVEALFHSFRSVEGLISQWARSTYPDDVKYEQDQYGKWVWFVKKTIQNHLPEYKRGKFPRDNRIKLFSQSLYDLLHEGKPESRTDADMIIFLNDARDQRNELFHQLLGISKEKVYESWSITLPNNSESEEEWKIVNQHWQKRILRCLELVSGKEFESLEEASLMVQVHQELERAIADL